jgi:large-conductance mechanosensitive channel
VTVVINTMLTLFAIFLVVRGINKMRALGAKPAPEVVDVPAVVETPSVPEDVALLSEIRDLLRAKA